MELTRVRMRCAQRSNVDRFVSTQIIFTFWHANGTDDIFVGRLTSLKMHANQGPSISVDLKTSPQRVLRDYGGI